MTFTYKSFIEAVSEAGGSREDAAAALGYSMGGLNSVLSDLGSAKLTDQQQRDATGFLDRRRRTVAKAPASTPTLNAGPALAATPAEPAAADRHPPDTHELVAERATSLAQVGNAAAVTVTIAPAVESEATADAEMNHDTAQAQPPRSALRAGLARSNVQPAAKAPKGRPAPRGKPPVLPKRDDVPSPSVAAGAVASETGSTPARAGDKLDGAHGVGLGREIGQPDRPSEPVTPDPTKSLSVDISVDAGANSPDAADGNGFSSAELDVSRAESTASDDQHDPLADVEFKHVDDSSERGGRYEMVLLGTTRLDHAASAEIAAIANSIRQHLKRVHNDVFEIGRALLIAKEKLRHGDWLPWLAAEFGWTPRSAQKYMNVAARLGDKCESLSHLGMEILYKLAAPSTPGEVVAAVTSMAEVGKKVTLPDVTRLIHEFKPKEPGKTAVANSQSQNTTEDAFELLSRSLEPDRLQRLGHLLGRCDIVKLVAMIDRYDPSEEPVAA